jgi:hypothetical protein
MPFGTVAQAIEDIRNGKFVVVADDAVLVMFCLLPVPVVAEIYQTHDEHGNIIYTDVPPKEGAPAVKLPPVNVFETPDPFEFPNKTPAAATIREFRYHKLEIVSPADDETILINTANISIEITLLPGVNRSAGHRLELLWDNRVLAQNQLSYQIADADRGSHVIEARVVDENGQILIRAAPVTVHIKQPFRAP